MKSIEVGFKYSQKITLNTTSFTQIYEVIGKYKDIQLTSNSLWRTKEDVLEDVDDILQVIGIPQQASYSISVNEVSEKSLLHAFEEDKKCLAKFRKYKILTIPKTTSK